MGAPDTVVKNSIAGLQDNSTGRTPRLLRLLSSITCALQSTPMLLKGRRTLQAAMQAGAAHILAHVIRIATSLILTRLLFPSDFGLMALVSIISLTLLMLSDIGLRVSVVQSPRGAEPAYLNTVWMIGIYRGLLLGAATILAALLIFALASANILPAESTWGHPLLPYLLAATSLTPVITGFLSPNFYLMQRQMNLWPTLRIELGSQIFSAVVGIVFAYLFQSVWALVASNVLSILLISLCSHYTIKGPPSRFQWDSSAAQEVLSRGRWIMLSSVLSVFAANMDRLALGLVATASTLGNYSLAFNLIGLVDSLWGRMLGSIAFPKLSEAARSETRQEFDAAFAKYRLYMDSILIVAAGALYAGGPAVISLLYDARYAEAAAIVQMLSFLLLFAKFNIFNTAYVVLGYPSYQAIINAGKLLSLMVGIPLGYVLFGTHGAICAVALHGLGVLPIYYVLNHRTGLNDFRLELGLLAGWPLGYAIGLCAAGLIAFVHPM